MKKVFMLEELDCANCARKMEDGIRAIEGVKAVSVNFLSQRLTLEAEEADFEAIMKKAEAIIRRVEPDCKIAR